MTSWRTFAAMIAGLAFAVTPWLLAPRTIAPFATLYAMLSIEPPAATRTLVAYPQVLLVLPLVVVAACFLPARKTRRDVIVLTTGALMGSLGYFAMIVLLYWPTLT